GAAPIVGSRRLTREPLAWSAATICFVMLVGALALGAIGYFQRAPTEAPAYRTSILPPDNATFVTAFDLRPPGRFALSPDGRRLAFIAVDASGLRRLWLRSLDALVAQPLAGTEDA